MKRYLITITFFLLLLNLSQAQVSVCTVEKTMSLCSSSGEPLFPAVYDTIFPLVNYAEDSFGEKAALFIAHRNGKVNYLNDTSYMYVPYTEPDGTEDERLMQIINEKPFLKGGVVDLYSPDGEKLVTNISSLHLFEYDMERQFSMQRDIFQPSPNTSLGYFYEETPLIYKTAEGFGVLSQTGERVIPPKFDWILPDFYKGQFYVSSKGRQGILTTSGTPLTDIVYDTVIRLETHDETSEDILSLGYSGGTIRSKPYVMEYFAIDPNSPYNEVPAFDTIYNYYFSGGTVDIYNSTGKAIARKAERVQIYTPRIDPVTGEVMFAVPRELFEGPEFPHSHTFPNLVNYESPLILRINKKWGAIKPNGTQMAPFEYDSLVPAKAEGMAWAFAKLKGKWGAVEEKGNTTIPFSHDMLKEVSIDNNPYYLFKKEGKLSLTTPQLTKVNPNFHNPDSAGFFSMNRIADPLLIEYMITQGADVNKPGFYGTSPLFEASYHANAEVVKLMIKHGADVHRKEEFGMTPLHHAANKGNIEISQILIENGADINVKDEAGQTPLFFAVQSRDPGMVQFLIDKGAQVDIVDSYGKTPLELAQMMKSPEIVKLLEK